MSPASRELRRRRLAASATVLAALLVSHVATAEPCLDPCTDHNVCTVNDHCSDDVCRGAALPNGTPCDDGNPGTRDDLCAAGVCEGVATDGGGGEGDAGGEVAGPAEAGSSEGCAVVAGRQGSGWPALCAALAAWIATRGRSLTRRARG